MAQATKIDFYYLKALEWGISFYEARELIEAKMEQLSKEVSERPKAQTLEPV